MGVSEYLVTRGKGLCAKVWTLPGFCSRQMGQIWPNDSALGVELTVSPTPDSNHQKVVHFTSQNHVVNLCVNLKLGMVYTNYAPTPVLEMAC